MFKGIKSAFWLANVLEACERLAYFGIRAVLPLMMVSESSGGLHLSYTQLGMIYGIWALLQCLIPMVSGGFSESFGYRKSLFAAYIINIAGYVMMANILPLASLFVDGGVNSDVNFALMMISGCMIGIGTAIFKPPVQGVVAKSLNESNSGFGFGLFYWVVNVGGFLAPMCASALRGTTDAPTWHYVFYSAAIVTTFNFIVTLLFFKEPERTPEEIAAHKGESVVAVFVKTIKTLWDDKSMLLFLLIVSGFWLMFMQLWDLLPNFLNEWTDRRGVGEALLSGAMSLDGSTMDAPGWATNFVMSFLEPNGAIKPEVIINIDSAAIIIFVLPLSAFFARYRMMTSLILGMIISVIGFVLSGVTMSGGIAALAIFIFAIGEIICSPKFSEYIGMTAPEDKKAIYMGYSNIPFAIGWASGNLLSGPMYQAFSSKATLARQWLVEHGNVSPDALNDAKLEDLMSQMQDVLASSSGQAVDAYHVNEVLWNAYNPWMIWIILGSIGVLSMIGMIVFYYSSGMKEREEAKAKEAKLADAKADEEKAGSEETSEKSDEAAEKSDEAAEKSDEAAEKSDEAAEKSDEAAEKSDKPSEKTE